MKLVVLDRLCVLIKDTGHDITASAVKDNQMVNIRASGGFVLRHSTMIDGANSSFSITGHTVTNCVNRFDDGCTQRGFCTAAIFGGHLDLFIGQGVERFR